MLSRRGLAVRFAFEGRYQGARHFVSPGVSRHIADAASASTVYDFLRKDDLHSFVRVCAVNASMHLREAVYSAIRDDGVGTKGAGTVGGGWVEASSFPAVCSAHAIFQTVAVVRPMQDPGPPRPLCRRFGTASSMTTPRGAPWRPRWTPSLNQRSLTTRTSRACCLLWTFALLAIDAVIFVARVHTWQAFSCFASRSDDGGGGGQAGCLQNFCMELE